MRQAHTTHEVTTRGRGLFEFTADAARFLSSEKAGTGVLTVFIRHTSASLLIQENADPDVKTDLDRWLSRLVKDATLSSSTPPKDLTTCRHTCAPR